MKAWACIALSICALAAVGHTQTAPTQQSIEAKLHGPFLMLRGMWEGGKLTFDSQGNLIGTAEKALFSLSAVMVTQIQLSDTQLEIRGRRAGLDFSGNNFSNSLKIAAKPYSKTDVDIVVSRDAQHPEALEPALDRVFSVGIDEMLAKEAPSYWQPLLRQSLHLRTEDKAGPPNPGAGVYHPGGGTRNPILRYAPDDLLQREVKLLGVTGVSVIGLIVDAIGMPQRVSVVRPLGMGADEYAVAEVLQYRFEPAMYQGHAVPVQINIEVNFRRY